VAQQKFWMVYAVKNEGRLDRFDNLDDAEDEARRKAVSGDVYILAPVGYVKQPVPDLLITYIKG
jgi:hypothetical protein